MNEDKAGARKRAGRKCLNGQDPGGGRFAMRWSITVPLAMRDWLADYGQDDKGTPNFSRGIRRAAIAAGYGQEEEKTE